MINLVFNCLFLSDVVLNAQTATVGSQKTLDYIPGSNFLGIIAKKYLDYDKEKAYDIFHSGKIQFGDAHISKHKKRSYKTPFAWYTKKTGGQELFVHHKLSEEMKAGFRRNGIQLKQQRQGFFFYDEEGVTRFSVKNKYYQKSAQDREKRRSADKKMFGYEALPALTEWQFSILMDDAVKDLKDEIIKSLEGQHFIGRSRTAQFGRINIAFIEEETSDNLTIDGNQVVIYADSNLCFFNDFGQPTLNPSIQDLGLPGNCKIDKENSQIRSTIYAPWNFKRATRDADRICIAKGSVLVIDTNGEKIDAQEILKGIGAYTNEGLGRVIINPGFLNTDQDGKLTIAKGELNAYTFQKKSPIDHADALLTEEKTLLELLRTVAKEKENEKKSIELTYKFYEVNGKYFKGLSASQWGGIRELATRSENYDDLMKMLFGKTEEPEIMNAYLMHGVSKEHWDKNGRRNKLFDFIKEVKKEVDPVQFTILLSSFMAKKASQK